MPIDSTNNGAGDNENDTPQQPHQNQNQSQRDPNTGRNFSMSSIKFFRRNTDTSNSNSNQQDHNGNPNRYEEEDDEEDEDDGSIMSLNEHNYMEELFGTQHIATAMTNRTTADEERGQKEIPNMKTQEESSSSDTSQEGYAEKPPSPPQPPSTPPSADQPPVRPQISRRRSSIASTVEKVQKYRWWDEEFKQERLKIITRFLINYVFLVVGFTGVLSIYTGSYYQRDLRYKDLKMAVIIADQPVGDLPNIVGQTVEYYFTEVPAVQPFGDFEVWNYTRISELAESKNHTIRQEIHEQIHHQKFWAIFYVHENATLDWYQALVTQDQELPQ
ncbi:predicted protein, partial [Candida tropicalis MYA-3404]